MEIRKIGYVSAVLTIIIGIVLFLIMDGKIKIDTSEMLLGSTSFIFFLISAVLLFFGFCLLTNIEHQIIAIIDIVIAFLYAGIIILFMIISKEDAINLINVLLYGSEAAGTLAILNIPFLVRTQSRLHRYFKYLVVLIIGVASFLVIGLVNTYVKIIQTGDVSIFGTTSEKTMKEVEALEIKSKVAIYFGVAGFIGIICNPMIAYASSDGLGGGGSSKTPKLVPKNAATDPNMSDGINPNQGINYGEMPVPEGVISNPSPVVDPAPVQAVATPEPIAPAPVAPATPEVPVTPVTPAPAPVQGQNLNASEVAPELQFLLNNNNK